jgi:hypothetical protein
VRGQADAARGEDGLGNPGAAGVTRLFVPNGYKAKAARKYLRYRHRISTLLMSDFLAVSGHSMK